MMFMYYCYILKETKVRVVSSGEKTLRELWNASKASGFLCLSCKKTLQDNFFCQNSHWVLVGVWNPTRIVLNLVSVSWKVWKMWDSWEGLATYKHLNWAMEENLTFWVPWRVRQHCDHVVLCLKQPLHGMSKWKFSYSLTIVCRYQVTNSYSSVRYRLKLSLSLLHHLDYIMFTRNPMCKFGFINSWVLTLM